MKKGNTFVKTPFLFYILESIHLDYVSYSPRHSFSTSAKK